MSDPEEINGIIRMVGVNHMPKFFAGLGPEELAFYRPEPEA